ncbi:MAG: SPOR domain-containing protein [Deltaproteobacteria bacterium]|nr:SPOR domain-containing protein [Deltaproteobacteria bacterium]
MKPKPYNRKKRFLFELSRSQLFLSIAGALFVVSWIFILGIFVGRGYVSDTISRTFTDKIQKLQEEKKALMDKYLVQEKKDTIPQEEILNPSLEFFNKPSQRDTVITQQRIPQPAPKPLSREAKGDLSDKPDSLETKTESKFPPIETKVPKTPAVETKVARAPQENLAKSGPFIVQIGSYREEPTAQSCLKRLSEKGYQAQLKIKDLPQKGGKWYRVQIGPFQGRLEAEKALIRLEHDGFQAVVLDKNY